ncbi:MAG: hypothetical protein Kow0069_01100 [Promethearchaeota archaeon]
MEQRESPAGGAESDSNGRLTPSTAGFGLLVDQVMSRGNLNLRVGLVRLGRSFLLLATDRPEFDLGTVVLSTPPQSFQVRPVASSFSLFGLKNDHLSRLVAKKASLLLKAPVLALCTFRDLKPTAEAARAVVEAVQAALNSAVLDGQVGEGGGKRVDGGGGLGS